MLESSSAPPGPDGAPAVISGLSTAEASFRLEQDGPNRLAPPRRRPAWRIAVDALREPMFVLLLAAVGLYFLLGDLAEALFLLAGAAATIALVVVQEARSERALAALRVLAEPMARVIRDGAARQVPAAELVRGDVVLVGEGGRAPADAVLIQGDPLTVDESVLTGESAPVTRSPGAGATEDRTILAGTLVVAGQAMAAVTQTGRRTRLGQIGVSLATLQQTPTPLQLATRRLVGLLGVAALGLAGTVVLLHGLLQGRWAEGALAGVTIGIATIPEEFPMVLTVFLALGGWRLAQRQVLVRRAAAIEALGAISVLCVDKTGTLTENRMRVAAVWRAGRVQAPDVEADPVLSIACLASSVSPLDPMDRAVREACGALAASDTAPLRSYPLRPDRLAFIQAWPARSGGVTFAAKGAPEAVFALCRSMDVSARTEAEAAVGRFARQGLRVLAVASASLDRDHGGEPDQDFTFEGLLAFEDPVRGDVPEAIVRAREAGVKIVMITGDYPATALAIARDAGLDVAGGVVTGAELAALPDEALRARIRGVRVFARVAPDQKLRLVEALKVQGERVGMFGDGVNDAPALEAAHVGVAMGRRGADVAREAADLVLLDDRFASVVAGVAEGRRIFANLRAALTYLVVVHTPIAGVALLAPLLGAPPVLFPMQVVLFELIIDPMCALVFEGRGAAPGEMKRPPRPADEPLFGSWRLSIAILEGLLLLAVVFGSHLSLLARGQPETASRAAAFIVLVGANLGAAAVVAAAGRARSRGQRLTFAGIAAVAVAFTAAAVLAPDVADLFGFTPLPPGLAATALALGLGAGLGVSLLGRALAGLSSAPRRRHTAS